VDTHTDAKIRKALKRNLPETTKIIIAQLVASDMDADRIVQITKRHHRRRYTRALLKSDNVYREVYESQNKEVSRNEAEKNLSKRHA
jgi:ATP-binding cassette subfamily B protein